MAAKVSILLEAIDKASAVIKKTGGSFGDLAGRADRAVKSITGFSLAEVATAASIGAAAKAARDAVMDYSAYVEKIDKMTMSTGMSAEEMSRLAQVADDFRVDINGLEGALGMALKNGFNPTTENLATLADELQNIQDPTQRAEKLTAIFGRQWETVIPLLDRGGAAIREASAGISDSLIVTADAIDANRDFQKSLDDLGDTWTGVKNEFAKGLITPQNLESLKVFSRNIQDLQRGVSIFQVLASNQRMYLNVETAALQVYQDKNRYLTEQYEAQQKLASGMPDWTALQSRYAETMAETNRGLDEAARNSAEYASKLDEVNAAQASLQEAQAAWREGEGGEIGALLEQAGLSADKLSAAYETVDSVMGTNLETQRQSKERMRELVDQYTRTGDLDQFRQGILEYEDAFMKYDESVEKSTALTEELIGQLENFARVWTATARIRVEGAVPGNDPADVSFGDVGDDDTPVTYEDLGDEDTSGDQFASGGDVVAGKPVMVGELGPEPFVPAVDGRIMSNDAFQRMLAEAVSTRGGSGVMINSLTVVLPGVTNAQQLLGELSRLTRRGGMAGVGYAGR